MDYGLVILAGGKSTRMGSNKAKLPFGDESLIEYMIKRFRPHFEDIYISVDRISDLDGIDISRPMIEDSIRGIGPMGGIYSVLKETNKERLIFVSVDNPFADAAIAANVAKSSNGADVTIIRRNSGKIESLFAVYSRRCLKYIEECIGERNYSLKRIHDKVECKYIEEKDLFVGENYDRNAELCFFNMNHRQDYYRALSHLKISVSDTKRNIPAVSFVAPSNTGKTTYIEKLIVELKKRNLRLGVIKHDAHDFEIDKPGKDSYRFTHAGADAVAISSMSKTAMVFLHDEPVSVDDIMEMVGDVDLIITEGYKKSNLKKIEVLRKGYNEEFVCDSKYRLAVVADYEVETEYPLFPLDNPEKMADFLVNYVESYKKEF